jgi:hypothetical protein
VPDMSEMKCAVCEQVKTKDELVEHNGVCTECQAAFDEIPDKPDEDSLSDPEMRGAINRYRQRQAYMKKYNQRPENIIKRREYMKSRAKRDRDLIRKAKELGVTLDEEA